MGLLDSVIGAMGQGSGGAAGGGSQAELLNLVMGLLSQGGAAGGAGGGVGGLAGLVQKFQQGGLADVVQSWISTGQNLPVSPDQLGRVLGGDTVAGMAGQLGVNPGDLLGQLSQLLPQVVDKLTPQGQLPSGDVGGMGDLGGLIGGLLGGMGRR